MSVFLNRS